MNTELQKCMDTDKDNHIIYFGEKHHLDRIWRPAYSLGVFHRRTDTDDNHHRHPLRKDAL